METVADDGRVRLCGAGMLLQARAILMTGCGLTPSVRELGFVRV
ncbi:hypothetical protein [Paenibacillus piri]|nr:hypothetical protein [Paenibacillus piri]